MDAQLQLAIYELACPRCQNRGSVMKPLGLDECPECRGELRNSATIELLKALVKDSHPPVDIRAVARGEIASHARRQGQ